MITLEFPRTGFTRFLDSMAEHPEATWTFIEMCAQTGVFYSTPSNTIMARPVSSSLTSEALLGFVDLTTPLTSPHDCWHILYASGDPRFFFDLCPYELPFVSWHRNKGRGNLRRYKFQKLRARWTNQNLSPSLTPPR